MCRIFMTISFTLLSFGQCLKFDDIIQDDIDEIKNAFVVKIAVLEQKVIDETVQLREMRMRVNEIEREMVDVRADKLEGNRFL